MRILVIEDDLPMQTILARILRDGNEVHCTGSLYDGIELARLLQPELILLDLMLTDSFPDNTVDHIPNLLTASPNSAIVAVTGNSTQGIVEKVKAFGAAGLAEKGMKMHTADGVLTEISDVLSQAGDRYNECRRTLSNALGCQL